MSADDGGARPNPHPDGLAPHVAVIGAGVAGVSCGRALSNDGIRVTLFERARDVGGRCGTRSAEALHFDHGAQYFSARDAGFQRLMDDCIAQSVVGIWPGTVIKLEDHEIVEVKAERPRLVGVPGMRNLVAHLAHELIVLTGHAISHVHRDESGWRLTDDAGTRHGPFSALVIATAPEQAARLLAAGHPLLDRVEAVRSKTVWCAMVAFDEPLPCPFDAAFTDHAVVPWTARNSSKPGRPSSPDTWVVHAGPEWSRQRFDSDRDDVARELLGHFFAALDLPARQPVHLKGHRWGLSTAINPLDVGALWSAEESLAICGDWCVKPRVEGAYLSGIAAAQRLMTHLVRA